MLMVLCYSSHKTLIHCDNAFSKNLIWEYQCVHSMGEETEAQRNCQLCPVPQLISGRAGLCTRRWAPESMLVPTVASSREQLWRLRQEVQTLGTACPMGNPHHTGLAGASGVGLIPAFRASGCPLMKRSFMGFQGSLDSWADLLCITVMLQ